MSDDKRRIESVAHQPIRSLEAGHAQIIGSAVPQQHRFKQRDRQGMADEQDPCADRHPWGAGEGLELCHATLTTPAEHLFRSA